VTRVARHTRKRWCNEETERHSDLRHRGKHGETGDKSIESGRLLYDWTQYGSCSDSETKRRIDEDDGRNLQLERNSGRIIHPVEALEVTNEQY
jgi:hypothetical protein